MKILSEFGVRVDLLDDQDRDTRPGVVADVYPFEEDKTVSITVFSTYIDICGSSQFSPLSARRFARAINIACRVLESGA